MPLRRRYEDRIKSLVVPIHTADEVFIASERFLVKHRSLLRSYFGSRTAPDREIGAELGALAEAMAGTLKGRIEAQANTIANLKDMVSLSERKVASLEARCEAQPARPRRTLRAA